MNNPRFLVNMQEGLLNAKPMQVEDDMSETHTASDYEDSDSDEEFDDDSSCYSDSSSEHSLGSIIEKAGFQMPPVMIKMNRTKSLPNMMELEVDVNEQQMQAEHRKSFSNFMDRMKNCDNGYFQQDVAAAQPEPKPVARSVRSTGALYDINKSSTSTDIKSPANYFKDEILGGVVPEVSEAYWESYFLPITPDRLQGYTHESVGAIRALDVATLRKIAQESGDATMNSCTRQGESLLHVACRRGNEEVFRFLVEEANAEVKVRDDWNKTGLHDLCWNHKVGNTAQFSQVQLLLLQAPELLFAKDKRGFTALQYVPKDCWAAWCRFLGSQKEFIVGKVATMHFDH